MSNHKFGCFDEFGEPIWETPKFDAITRRHLEQKFLKAWSKANPDKDTATGESLTQKVITSLQSYAHAEVLADPQVPHKYSVKGRREKINAVATALEVLEAAMQKTAPFDLLYALTRGLEKIKKHAAERAEIDSFNVALNYVIQSRPNTKASETEIRLLTEGVREFSMSVLPPMPGMDGNKRLIFAMKIAELLTTHKIPVTTSSTGLAGTLFESVYDLANIPLPKTSYWLRKAKELRGLESMYRYPK